MTLGSLWCGAAELPPSVFVIRYSAFALLGPADFIDSRATFGRPGWTVPVRIRHSLFGIRATWSR